MFRREVLRNAVLMAGALSVDSAFQARAQTVIRVKQTPIRIGVLLFGTVSWELDTIRAHGFDAARHFSIEETPLANSEGAKIALTSGAVDMIVSDWVWVARQRASGEPLSFIPYSSLVGAILVPKESPIHSLRDLKGRKLGIVGGPLDKSWIFMRALALKTMHEDLDQIVERVFGAPPILNEQLKSGRIDAVLTNWNFAARLEADGYRRVISVNDALIELGFGEQIPLIGYVFHEPWGRANAEQLDGFAKATLDAKHLLAESDSEWQRLFPVMGAESPSILAALRDGYRQSIPKAWGAKERQAAAAAYKLMADLGGPELVGQATELDPKTFWDGVTY